ncbi:DUF397 domain-containing protein [Streptomyces candidus]|uniref:DUF397 domain-containing protein n=1 Tax=Streptomyces candidus TaxID=67283 RepID=A0A7X0HDW8_9ACTN|nr:DUF397 domain-containing protein [Streptomyces candidus]MBB6435753.1 hypothetical protein [Streptomyces candidus]GHH46252.1 hypothetical protein GCM10018773_36940 [Streptomyces candidus]
MSNETLNWRKSSHSGPVADDCVEVADNIPGLTHLRDTKLADTGPVISVTDHAWNTFLSLLK